MNPKALRRSLEEQLTPSELMMDVKLPETQEKVEVTAPEYPGLNIELPTLDERLSVARARPGLITPTHTPNYYQGGQILTFWGVPMDSGQLLSLPVVKR